MDATQVLCPRRNKWLKRCHFEARYDTIAPSKMKFDSIAGSGSVDVVEAMKTKIYLRDVCTTCGKVIERSAAPTLPREQGG